MSLAAVATSAMPCYTPAQALARDIDGIKGNPTGSRQFLRGLDQCSLRIVGRHHTDRTATTRISTEEHPMNRKDLRWKIRLLGIVLLIPTIARAQGTAADYTRALLSRFKFQALAINTPERANWIDQASRFWYRKSVRPRRYYRLIAATGSATAAPRFA